MHGHDHMHEVIVAHRFDDPRGIVGVHFECNIGGSDDFEHFAQEFDIKRDEQCAALDRGFDLNIAFSGFLGLGVDLDFSRSAFFRQKVQANNVIALTCDDLGLFAGFEKRGGRTRARVLYDRGIIAR